MEILQKVIDEIESSIQYIRSNLDEINELTTAITEIPAPPFNEGRRAEFIREYFELIGYSVRIDTEGNVIAKKTAIQEPLILSAHLDTVFDLEEIKVERDGDVLRAPGVGDDSRGLANLLIISKCLYNTPYANKIMFVATVGEEGRGDLRGVKTLFSDDESYNNIRGFITIDGSGTSRVVDQGIGSRRFRLHFRGPGGHSYGSFGTVNPLFALGDFMSTFPTMKTKDSIKSTYSLGVTGGGTAINAIPEHVWVDIDLRSETSGELDNMEDQVQNFAKDAAEKEMNARTGTITFELETVGRRPAGRLDEESIIRRCIESVHDNLDLELEYSPSSTDANVPLSLGIPAIAVSGVKESGRAHTQDEWIDSSVESLEPIVRNLILVCLLSKIL